MNDPKKLIRFDEDGNPMAGDPAKRIGDGFTTPEGYFDDFVKRMEQQLPRREEVEKTVSAARQAILDLPDSEYFALLSRQIGALGTESGELRLSARDLGRLPRDFEKSLPEGIALSKESAPIDGGFLLLQNGIEINNSLSALFDAARDSLSDLAAEALFS